MENKKGSTVYYVLGLIAFVVVIVIMFSMVKKDKGDVSIDNLDQNLEQEILTPTEDMSTGSINNTTNKKISSAISYADALVKYKDTRIQLDKACQATPNNVTYKNNTSIMIDNRAPVARSVKIDSVYSIKPYSFKIVKLSSSTLPITWLVDCDQSQNVATILLQK